MTAPNKWEECKNGSWRFVTKTMAIEVVVHRHIHEDPEHWFVSCFAVWPVRQRLGARDIESARAEALALVRSRLDRLLKEFS